MKRIGLTLMAILYVVLPMFSQNVSIPDANFLAALIEEGVDTDEDGQISFAEAEEVIKLSIYGHSITDMTGIEAFIKLEELHCGGNDLSSLDVSNNIAFTSLECDENRLTHLDVSGCNNLMNLHCSENLLTSLDLSNNTELSYFYVDNNQLTSLDVSACDSLAWLMCTGNQLTSLDVSSKVKLVSLDCNYNQLTNLDVSACDSLIYLNCHDNQLTRLDISDNTALESLICSKNLLTNLDVSYNTNLCGGDWHCFGCQKKSSNSFPIRGPGLSCSNNLLTSLDVSGNIKLGSLNCSFNLLSNLDVSACDSLAWLDCSGNQLSDLDILNNTGLEYLDCSGMQITDLDVSINKGLEILNCSNNQIISLDVTKNAELWSNYVLWGRRGLLTIAEMPGLRQVCVPACLAWDGEGCMPENTDDWQEHVETEGSPNVFFTTECSDIEAPYIMAVDSLYQPDYIEATSSEDGVIYLVPENTDTHLGLIRALSIDSAAVVSDSPANISLSGLDNGIYWLYARDSTGNISEPKAIAIMGVGIPQRRSDQFRLYPNPTNDLLTIETEKPDHYSIEIASLNGQQILMGEMDGTSHQIDLSPFQKGIYFITIRSKNFVTTRKIIKL